MRAVSVLHQHCYGWCSYRYSRRCECGCGCDCESEGRWVYLTTYSHDHTQRKVLFFMSVQWSKRNIGVKGPIHSRCFVSTVLGEREPEVCAFLLCLLFLLFLLSWLRVPLIASTKRFFLTFLIAFAGTREGRWTGKHRAVV